MVSSTVLLSGASITQNNNPSVPCCPVKQWCVVHKCKLSLQREVHPSTNFKKSETLSNNYEFNDLILENRPAINNARYSIYLCSVWRE